jgi:hypothetical protein
LLALLLALFLSKSQSDVNGGQLGVAVVGAGVFAAVVADTRSGTSW